MDSKAGVEARAAWRIWQHSALILAALFAVTWAVARARTQALTVDETDTYFWFVAKSSDFLWYPFPNNHLLNTLLMWASTHALGASSLTLRLPALLGGALYIAICYFLCRNITNRFTLQFPIFICLVFNPFIMDFMSTARGYSLANAFLVGAIAVPVWHRRADGPSLLTSCGLASLALGLSFSANFSFAFADLAVFFAITAWAVRRREEDSLARILSFCILPGLGLALILCGYPITHWPRKELWYGTHSLNETVRGLAEASLHQLNPRVRTLWPTAADSLRRLLLPVLAIVCALQLAAAALDGAWLRETKARWLGKLTAALAAMVTVTLLLHWLAFRFDNLPLPKTRTGIFLIPLCTLIAAAVAASPAGSAISRWLRAGTRTGMVILACYFLLCLRAGYFEEYDWDADLKDVYSVLARLNHTYNLEEVAAISMYYSPLDFYRISSKRETFTEFLEVGTPPAGKSIYVLRWPFYQAFMEQEKLRMIYHGRTTEVVVAVRSEDQRLPSSIEP